MSMLVREIQEWLSNFNGDKDRVGVDEGGLALTVEGTGGEEYLEVGGVSDDDLEGHESD
jgi:hypothetical protein